jgi:hypothetical protein
MFRDHLSPSYCQVKGWSPARQLKLAKAPFGFSVGDDGGLVPIPEQQRAIQRMRELRAEGKSLMAIAEILRAEGTPISHMGVKSALRA